MGYYDIVDCSSWIKDYMLSKRWEEVLQTLGISEDDLVKMVYEKLDPLIEQICTEFSQSEWFFLPLPVAWKTDKGGLC